MSAIETAVFKGVPVETAASSVQPPRKLRGYRLPGEGSALGLSLLSVGALLLLWWAATTFHWVPPLFLPSPQAVGHAFLDAWRGDIQGGQPLAAVV